MAIPPAEPDVSHLPECATRYARDVGSRRRVVADERVANATARSRNDPAPDRDEVPVAILVEAKIAGPFHADTSADVDGAVLAWVGGRGGEDGCELEREEGERRGEMHFGGGFNVWFE